MSLLTIDGKCYPNIPMGPKNDKYFMVENQQNCARKKRGVKQTFHDECGVWVKASHCTYLCLCNTMQQVYKIKKEYCVKVHSEGYKAISPQPDLSEVISITKYSSKKDHSCKQRISWINEVL